jgi:DNA-3-methyladenine glycosylase II
MLQFNRENFHPLCDQLAETDQHLKGILVEYSYPPLWTRPNTFDTLVLTILEQQVSLASAYAAYRKLRERLPVITPTGILTLSDQALRACYFSRQKMVYVRELAAAILSKKINLKSFEKKEDDIVRKELTALKGIGNWTADIYLLHALQRTDIFPLGDLALVNAVQMVTNQKLEKAAIEAKAAVWRPYRSIATMIFWHYYLKKRKIVLVH